jgi:hypothetical protein
LPREVPHRDDRLTVGLHDHLQVLAVPLAGHPLAGEPLEALAAGELLAARAERHDAVGQLEPEGHRLGEVALLTLHAVVTFASGGEEGGETETKEEGAHGSPHAHIVLRRPCAQVQPWFQRLSGNKPG